MTCHGAQRVRESLAYCYLLKFHYYLHIEKNFIFNVTCGVCIKISKNNYKQCIIYAF